MFPFAIDFAFGFLAGYVIGSIRGPRRGWDAARGEPRCPTDRPDPFWDDHSQADSPVDRDPE